MHHICHLLSSLLMTLWKAHYDCQHHQRHHPTEAQNIPNARLQSIDTITNSPEGEEEEIEWSESASYQEGLQHLAFFIQSVTFKHQYWLYVSTTQSEFPQSQFPAWLSSWLVLTLEICQYLVWLFMPMYVHIWGGCRVFGKLPLYHVHIPLSDPAIIKGLVRKYSSLSSKYISLLGGSLSVSLGNPTWRSLEQSLSNARNLCFYFFMYLCFFLQRQAKHQVLNFKLCKRERESWHLAICFLILSFTCDGVIFISHLEGKYDFHFYISKII